MLRRLASVLALSTLSLWLPLRVQAAPSTDALLARAVKNTNAVRTLMHHDTSLLTTTQGSVSMTARSAEDEVKKREHDFESVTVHGQNSAGQVKSLHYTMEMIFMNNRTYYRSTLNHNTWDERSGMKMFDPYTGDWQQGRTTVPWPKKPRFTQIGPTTGGQIHVRSPFSSANGGQGTLDLWFTTGAAAYVVRAVEDLRYTKTRARQHIQMIFGPFNQKIDIEPPSTSTL
jgi:hypothetical protein